MDESRRREVLKTISANSNAQFAIWSDPNLKKTMDPATRQKILTPADGIGSSNPIIAALKLIILTQQKEMKNLQKKYAFCLLRFHQLASSISSSSSASGPSRQNTTPKKRRHCDSSEILPSSSHDHLNELSRNIFASPTRPSRDREGGGAAFASPTRTTSTPGTTAAGGTGGGRSRDLPSPMIERSGIYSTPDRVRPPKYPSATSHLLSSSPLRPTLFASSTSDPIPPPSPSSFSSVPGSHESRSSHDEKMLTSLSNRLNELEQLIKSFNLTALASKPLEENHKSTLPAAPLPPPPPISPPPSDHFPAPPSFSPLIPINLSKHTATAAAFSPKETSLPQGEEERDGEEISGSLFLHSKISTASLDALRTLHSTHREYLHPSPTSPCSIPSSLSLNRRHSTSPHTFSSSTHSPTGSVTTSSLLPPAAHRVPQVPLTDLSSVQSKMTSWRRRYPPPPPLPE
jgi:uncharacterized coiled-coil protein SlyX